MALDYWKIREKNQLITWLLLLLEIWKMSLLKTTFSCNESVENGSCMKNTFLSQKIQNWATKCFIAPRGKLSSMRFSANKTFNTDQIFARKDLISAIKQLWTYKHGWTLICTPDLEILFKEKSGIRFLLYFQFCSMLWRATAKLVICQRMKQYHACLQPLQM